MGGGARRVGELTQGSSQGTGKVGSPGDRKSQEAQGGQHSHQLVAARAKRGFRQQKMAGKQESKRKTFHLQDKSV